MNNFILFSLSQGYNLQSLNKAGINALHYAVDNEKVNAVRVLLENGADPNLKDKDGLTTLHYAVLVENRKIIELLLEKNADVDAKDNEGETPMSSISKDLKQFILDTLKKVKK